MALEFCTVFGEISENFLFFCFVLFASECAWTFTICKCCRVSNPSSVCLYRAVHPGKNIEPRKQVPETWTPLHSERSLVIETWINKWHDASLCFLEAYNNVSCVLQILQWRALVLWGKAQMPNCVWWINTPFCWYVLLLMWFHFVAALLCSMKHTCKPPFCTLKSKESSGVLRPLPTIFSAYLMFK